MDKEQVTQLILDTNRQIIELRQELKTSQALFVKVAKALYLIPSTEQEIEAQYVAQKENMELNQKVVDKMNARYKQDAPVGIPLEAFEKENLYAGVIGSEFDFNKE